MLSTAPTFKAADDPNLSFTDFSISGDFESTWTNAAASGQGFMFIYTRPVAATTPFSKAVNLVSLPGTYPTPATTSKKAGYINALGYTPVVGSKFFVQAWTTDNDYPQKQYVTLYTINVVA